MNINVIGPVNDLGYGTACLNIMLALRNLGHKVAYFPIDVKTITCLPSLHGDIRDMMTNAQMFDTAAPCLRIWHQFDMAQHVGYGRFVGMPIFELDTFTEIEKHHLGQLDSIIVNSMWAKEVVQANLPDYPANEVLVVPLGVDTEIFNNRGPLCNARKTTVFFAAGKWEVRKGHDILVQCFNKAFGRNDDVELQLLCNNPFLTEEQTSIWVRAYKGSELGDKVKILPRLQTHYDVARVMKTTDCGIFISRAEGWNLELLEMMACGKHVIATNCTAHTEYCTPDNAMLVDVPDKEPAYDGIWFNNQGNWAKHTADSIDQIVQYMRSVHDDKQHGGKMINEAGINTASIYTWKKSAKKLIGAFSVENC